MNDLRGIALCVQGIDRGDRAGQVGEAFEQGRGSRWSSRHGDLPESRGWEFEAWSELPEVELPNVQFLAGYRCAWLLDPELLSEIRGTGLDGVTLGEAFRAFPRRPEELMRAGVLHLLVGAAPGDGPGGTPLVGPAPATRGRPRPTVRGGHTGAGRRRPQPGSKAEGETPHRMRSPLRGPNGPGHRRLRSSRVNTAKAKLLESHVR